MLTAVDIEDKQPSEYPPPPDMHWTPAGRLIRAGLTDVASMQASILIGQPRRDTGSGSIPISPPGGDRL